MDAGDISTGTLLRRSDRLGQQAFPTADAVDSYANSNYSFLPPSTHPPMPELPEVETYRRFLDELVLQVPVVGLRILDAHVLTTPEETLRAAVVGHRFTSSKRIGKQLLLLLDDPPGAALTLHFGMTGDVAAYRDDHDRPRFVRVELTLDGGLRIGFIDPRKFGRVGLASDVTAFLQAKKLGPDALDELTVTHLAAALTRRKNAVLKAALLDQRLTAGLGNWIVDEVLFQARIHPARRAGDLDPAEVKRLHAAIGLVLRTAVEAEARYRDFPVDFLIHAREWEEAPTGASTTHCPRHPKTLIQKHYVGGRATYWCERCQPVPAGWVPEPEAAEAGL
jgi:formamidopyrimidine-DNA glycosylase